MVRDFQSTPICEKIIKNTIYYKLSQENNTKQPTEESTRKLQWGRNFNIILVVVSEKNSKKDAN